MCGIACIGVTISISNNHTSSLLYNREGVRVVRRCKFGNLVLFDQHLISRYQSTWIGLASVVCVCLASLIAKRFEAEAEWIGCEISCRPILFLLKTRASKVDTSVDA
ncbi:hypothetical protein DPMN_103089 [Dreissena polymorpha]|uniref:Uncharacterized protein n=1 Tax=Dreissena polymorpha TaxID=45954 RepID=A0A9D4H733_DREPO|nr:hypothetical protein DPMN_102918 [Dreissena polymorpha]KAH3829859.1 hypothetical protein DPMN_103089 [Dreissena polymorpha]